ncbi:hypothetical protein [Streptomyces sp. NPDC048142]|uniref:hypothetical protein n=1 Tax=Streptomyces sp. NPDC048142 TaxID=3365501 RepID=UPI0037187008
MSLPWAARGLKIPYVVRNGRQSRCPAMAAALDVDRRADRRLPAADDLPVVDLRSDRHENPIETTRRPR